MLRTLISRLALSSLAFAAAACCGSVACDDRDKNADTLFFRFADTVPARAITTVYVVRTYTPSATTIPKPDNLNPVRDTARLLSTAASLATNRTIAISNNAPFTATANRKLNAYTYEIYTLDSADVSKKTKALQFNVTNVRLEGGFIDEDGCCTYYKNTLKLIDLYNQKVQESGIDLNRRQYALLQP